MVFKKFFLVCCASFLTGNVYGASKTQEVEIPRTAKKDIYRYFVIEETKKATIFQVTYKRVGQTAFDYGKVEINCPSKVIRLLGTSVKSVRDITVTSPGQWVKPALGTIEADMITYVCR